MKKPKKKQNAHTGDGNKKWKTLLAKRLGVQSAVAETLIEEVRLALAETVKLGYDVRFKNIFSIKQKFGFRKYRREGELVPEVIPYLRWTKVKMMKKFFYYINYLDFTDLDEVYYVNKKFETYKEENIIEPTDKPEETDP